MKLIIQASNVNGGGGAVLLIAILEAAQALGVPVQAFVDTRLKLPQSLRQSAINFSFIKPGIFSRLMAEYRLHQLAQRGDLLLAFGNLPPLLKSQADICLFLQNRYLLESWSQINFSLRVKARILMERLWFSSRAGSAARLLVQSTTMARMLAEKYQLDAEVMPFSPVMQEIAPQPEQQAQQYDFVYVASAEPHKNHRKLINAWAILAKEQIFPSLCLTFDSQLHPDIQTTIEQVKTQGARITNLGPVAPSAVANLYTQSRALIFPSLIESFGLPLIEADRLGLDILASELDYVRDVVNPADVFNPDSEISIARCVARYLQHAGLRTPVMSPQSFLHDLLADKIV